MLYSGNYLLTMKMTMMNKIRSIKQLKARQKKLEQRKNELEKAIRYDWLDVKNSIKPKNVASQVFAQFFQNDRQGETSSLAETLSQLAAVITKIAVEKAEEKMADWMGNKK
jgi:septal ring factor EnvC (AmiA/AmiB activator)